MRLDRTLEKEIRAVTGDGSRAAKFALLSKIDAAAADMSSPGIRETFCDCLRKHGRAVTAICVAVTLVERKERLDRWGLSWALDVVGLLPTNFTQGNKERAYINDGLHPTRICEYARTFIRLTSEA